MNLSDDVITAALLHCVMEAIYHRYPFLVAIVNKCVSNTNVIVPFKKCQRRLA